MAHNTRNWAAAESTDLIGSAYKLEVTGQFEARSTSEEAVLTEAAPQGINPAILILDMKVLSTGIGGQIVYWKDVAPFTRAISARQYADVTIRHDGESDTVKVEEILS
jgi:hypothetical protein